jgi:hypothetical protein
MKTAIPVVRAEDGLHRTSFREREWRENQQHSNKFRYGRLRKTRRLTLLQGLGEGLNGKSEFSGKA